MFKVFNFASVTIAMMAIGITAALANPVTQAKPNPSVVNSLEINLSDQIKPMLPKVENRKFQMSTSAVLEAAYVETFYSQL